MNILLLLALVAAPSDEIVLKNLPKAPGTYYVVIVRGGDGQLTARRIPPGQVVAIDGAPDDEPGPPDDPEPPVDGFGEFRRELGELVTAVVDPNKANARRALSRLYGSIAALPFSNLKSMNQSLNVMWAALKRQADLHDSWDTWKAGVDKLLKPYTELEQAKLAFRVVSEELAK